MYYIQLILSEKCNLNCKYCHLWNKKNKEKIKLNYINYLTKILKTNNLLLEFQGGEPLLQFDLIKKIYFILKNNFENVNFILTTNGLLLNEENITWLVLNNISVNISFDFFSTINNRLNWNKKLFKKLIDNINTISQYKKINLIGTFTEDWLKYKLDYYINFINQNFKHKHNLLFFIRPVIFINKEQKLNINIDSFITFFKKLSDKINNNFYKQKNLLLEFNKDIQKNTVCIDYDGVLYLNDYYKSYLKKYFKLDNYKEIFHIYNFLNIKNFNKFWNNLNFSFIDLQNFKINKETKRIIEDYKKLKQNWNYFIFNINPITKEIYKQI